MKHCERLSASNSAAVFPLLLRAWVFQERLLAPRVVYFSQNELVWECVELGDCQCGGYFVPSNPKSRDWTSKYSWRSAVELFTTLHLNVEQDRLPAFFGLADFYAQSVGASLKTDYLAGLWRKSLHIDLLWRIDSSAQTLVTQSNRIAAVSIAHTVRTKTGDVSTLTRRLAPCRALINEGCVDTGNRMHPFLIY
jgi:hypothetical protein